MQSADPSVENSRRRLYHLGRAQLARSISFWGGWGLGPCCLCAIRHAARSVDSGPRAYRRSVQSQRATTRIHIVCCVAVRASRQSCVLGLGRGPGAVACRDSGVLGVGLLSLSTTLFVMVFVLGSARRSCIYSGREEHYNKYTAACTAIVRVGPLAPLRFLHETVGLTCAPVSRRRAH